MFETHRWGGEDFMNIHFQKTAVYPLGLAPTTESDLLKMVELCGRTAYKSEDRISEDSAANFVLMLKKHGHLSVLEHSNIVLRIKPEAEPAKIQDKVTVPDLAAHFWKLLKERNAYHRIFVSNSANGGEMVISGSLRSWIESLGWFKNLDPGWYINFSQALNRFYPILFEAPSETPAFLGWHITVMAEDEQLAFLRKDPSSDLPVFIFKFVCDRGITHEVVRHRVLSFTQESTRYVNYKNRGMTLIVPEELEDFFDAGKGEFTAGDPLVRKWLSRAELIFDWYREDINRGLRPEIARDILPNLLKSEILVSGRWSGWKHFIELRDSSHAHPRIRMLAKEVKKYFQSLAIV